MDVLWRKFPQTHTRSHRTEIHYKIAFHPFQPYLCEYQSKQARKARRCDSITPDLKLSPTDPLTGVGARRCYRIKKYNFNDFASPLIINSLSTQISNSTKSFLDFSTERQAETAKTIKFAMKSRLCKHFCVPDVHKKAFDIDKLVTTREKTDSGKKYNSFQDYTFNHMAVVIVYWVLHKI